MPPSKCETEHRTTKLGDVHVVVRAVQAIVRAVQARVRAVQAVIGGGIVQKSLFVLDVA